MSAQASIVQAGDSLAKDLGSLLGAVGQATGSVVEASENSAKRMAQANLSEFGKAMLSLDGSLGENSNYLEADKEVTKIYENFKNVNVGSSQHIYDEMFDRSALLTVGRTRNTYRKKAVVDTTKKLLDAKEKELMFTGSVDSEYFQTWDKAVRQTGLISPDDSSKYFSNVQITKFNNQVQSFLGTNLSDPAQQQDLYNLMFGSQSKMAITDDGERIYGAVGNTPAIEVDKQRRTFESMMATYVAGKKAQTTQSLKKPTFTLQAGKNASAIIAKNAEDYLQQAKNNRDIGVVNISNKQITDQELYVEGLHNKAKVVATIEDSVDGFIRGQLNYEDVFKSGTVNFKLSNGQMQTEEVKASDYSFYMNKRMTEYENKLKSPITTPEERQGIVGAMVRVKNDSAGRVKPQYLIDLSKQGARGSFTQITSMNDITNRLEMVLQYNTEDGANELDSWITKTSVGAMSVEFDQLSKRTDLSNEEKIALARSSMYNQQSQFEDVKLIKGEFKTYLADVGSDIVEWKTGEQRFASGTMAVLNKRLNASLLGVTDFSGFIQQNTFLLEKTPLSTWIPFVGGEIEGILIIKPDGAENITDKAILEKIQYDAESIVGDNIADENLHNHRWGFSNTVRDGRSALTVTIYGDSGKTVYQRTYNGTELTDGLKPEEVQALEAANEKNKRWENPFIESF